MSIRNKVLLAAAGWLIAITALHAWLNVNWGAVLNNYRPLEKRRITVAYIPVTCQLTCPVTDYISKFCKSGEIFLPRMFQGFPEVKEALISNKVQAAFIVAPLAIVLVSQGVPIKVVYLGHRYGSAVVVRKDGPIKTFADMRGRTVAIRWALTKPMDRVMYTPLEPRKADFDMVRDLMIETGVLNKKIEFSDYTDTRFADKQTVQTAWKYQPGIAKAQ